MAAGEFVKVAAGQLRRASLILKQEAQSMLQERERTIRQKSNEITNNQARLRAIQYILNDPNRDSREKQRTAQEMQQLQRYIDAKQREMNELMRRLELGAQTKQRKAVNLDGRAGDLEMQASSL